MELRSVKSSVGFVTMSSGGGVPKCVTMFLANVAKACRIKKLSKEKTININI